MRPAIAVGVLWAQRLVLLLGIALVVAMAAALAVWLLLVDWQVLAG